MILRSAPKLEESKYHLARKLYQGFWVILLGYRKVTVLGYRFAGRFVANDRVCPRTTNRRLPASTLCWAIDGGSRQKLRSAHDTAMRDPGLAATRQRYQQARKEFRDKLRDALLKADPSVQPILEKVHRQRQKDR